MGKRIRRKNLKKPKSICSKEPANEVTFFVTNVENIYTEEDNEGQKLAKQIKESINEIYTEHINDLEQRKQKRLECRVPTDFFQPYNLVVNSTYQLKIKNQIQELKNFECCKNFRESFMSSTDIFIEYLQKHVKEFDGKRVLLQAIIIYETYHTLQNSITQIGAIVEDIISRYNFELVLKKKFYSRVAFDYLELLSNVTKKEHSEYREDIIRMKATLDNASKRCENEKGNFIEYFPTLYSESCSDEDTTVEALHNLPIDDIVRIVNQVQKKKGRKLKKKTPISTKENSTSPGLESTDIDIEIEDFKKRLELEKPISVKYRPSLSEEFVARLRQQLKTK
ncbi:hypothetical protein SteCoe_13496 [Stentor coeruleus]|uniref:Uncharacterized protein n=1 Tax=Stentor coeruleus TaxID=5963 RepID=A0A1R2C8B6_9CILI|nr:hypothetical protein SteCoe_13496 [Stentor coeruleus]